MNKEVSLNAGGYHEKYRCVIRRLDELGRITLPMELRKSMNLKERDALQISVDNGRVVLEKYTPCDIFTGATEDLVEFRGKKISKSTIRELAKLLEEEA